MTLIKYRRDGSLILSGAHEDALIWRQRSGQCERVNSPGFWLAAIEDIEPLTTDLEAQLEDSDVLVLYTDGVTESMNETREQFGLGRLTAVVERHGPESPAKVCAAVVQAIAAWSTSQLDDVSLLVARYARSTDS